MDIFNVLSMIGGLSLFLYGMSTMGNGLSKMAGGKLETILEKLTAAGIRCELDERPEKIGYKIREAQMEKVPYMLVAGGKEEENGTVSVRVRDSVDTETVTVEAFIEKITAEIKSRKSHD